MVDPEASGQIPTPAELAARLGIRAVVFSGVVIQGPEHVPDGTWDGLSLEEKMDALLGEPAPQRPVTEEVGGRTNIRNQQILGTVPVKRAARLAVGLPLITLDTHKVHEVDL